MLEASPFAQADNVVSDNRVFAAANVLKTISCITHLTTYTNIIFAPERNTALPVSIQPIAVWWDEDLGWYLHQLRQHQTTVVDSLTKTFKPLMVNLLIASKILWGLAPIAAISEQQRFSNQ